MVGIYSNEQTQKLRNARMEVVSTTSVGGTPLLIRVGTSSSTTKVVQVNRSSALMHLVPSTFMVTKDNWHYNPGALNAATHEQYEDKFLVNVYDDGIVMV